jgi:DNA-binding NarL/FixJ family response regulator
LDDEAREATYAPGRNPSTRETLGGAKIASVTAKGPIRVVVAEDHFVTRAGLAAIINAQADMRVVAEAETGTEAVEGYGKHRPDVMLVDLRLPEMSGLDVTAAVCREFPDARIIILTGSEGNEMIYRALQSGARAYLLKDIRGPQLLKAIRDVHEGRRVVPPEVAALLAERMPQSDLTPREMDVLKLIVGGKSNKEIATALGLSEGTVRTHVSNILGKMGVSDRTQAATAALQRGIVS